MAAPPYMKLWIADFLADTLHLTRAQVGSYQLLLMAMWRAGGRLPANDDKLARIARCTAKEWASDRETLVGLFQRKGGQLTHKRLAEEMAKAAHVSNVRKDASELGVAERLNKNSVKRRPNGPPNGDQLGTYVRSQKDIPQSPLGGPSDHVDQHFEEAWAGFPAAGLATTNREKSFAEWVKALPAAGGSAPLCRAARAYAAFQAAAGPQAKPTPAFHRWLADRRFESFLASGPARRRTWEGPPEVWAAVVEARDEDFAVSWLTDCGWQDSPVAAVVSASPTAFRRLREEIGPVLAGRGIQILEKTT